jgi:quercetin dioxygenase-like cupin family protein
MPDDLARKMQAQGLHPNRWSNDPAERYAAHDHPYDKVLAVERGSIRFELPATGGAIELATGDRLDLPATTLHGAIVGPDGVACLEAHLPAGSLGEVRRRPSGGW